MARRSQVLQHLLVKLPDLLGLVELKKGIQIGCPFVFLLLYIKIGDVGDWHRRAWPDHAQPSTWAASNQHHSSKSR